MKKSKVGRNLRRLSRIGGKNTVNGGSITPLQLAAAVTKAGYPISERTAGRWLSGNAPKVDADALPAICKVFGVNVTELYK